MAELITKKNHRPDCTADRPTPGLEAFAAQFPNFCVTCRATGRVVRSGMELPCYLCMNGRWRCPRCLWTPDINPNFWPGRCGRCGWSGPSDGAPLADCDCPEEITVENIRPIGKKSAVQKDKRARLEALAGISSASDSDVHQSDKKLSARAQKSQNERREHYADNRDAADYDRAITEE